MNMLVVMEFLLFFFFGGGGSGEYWGQHFPLSWDLQHGHICSTLDHVSSPAED